MTGRLIQYQFTANPLFYDQEASVARDDRGNRHVRLPDRAVVVILPLAGGNRLHLHDFTPVLHAAMPPDMQDGRHAFPERRRYNRVIERTSRLCRSNLTSDRSRNMASWWKKPAPRCSARRCTRSCCSTTTSRRWTSSSSSWRPSST